ncbi:helix-turn-helix transcriptional regulator [Phormidium sp. CLA17]|uniref:helix-turn-helix domain-containing protein n=1 Tax=Leptolyngbya sp. Cla-17 TaxID=2803751 RepID=UPI0014926D3B|nr:helix-turn-helix transcriptional regulator [Leptolyngbya sp. Cla-17]MBM0742567.1 helix-turn-helix transcriptional regulator [Leptolyngbya sp. Cla-17]
MQRRQRYELFQKALIDARQAQGLTQTEVAQHLGKPQSYVSKYESGERRLDVVEFLEVCDALSIAPQLIIQEIKKEHGNG